MSNPTEKGSTVHQSPITSHQSLPEPAWILDVQAATIACLFESSEKVFQLCEGEFNHCELCGERFPLWPINLWARHYVDAHLEIITLQQHQGVLALCTAGLTDAAKQFLSVQLVTRSSLRRRAYELGMTRFVDADGKFVEREPTRIIQ
jgi:hypothetical protein